MTEAPWFTADLKPVRVKFEGPPAAGKTYWIQKIRRFLDGQWCITQIDTTDPTGHTFIIYPNAEND